LTAALKKKGIMSFSPEVGIDALQSLLLASPKDSIVVLWANWKTYQKLATNKNNYPTP
jgi:hypothetical protein